MKIILGSNSGVYDRTIVMEGFTLAGHLTLSRDPVTATEAATKRYIDNYPTALNAENITGGIVPLPRIAESISGDITVYNGTQTLLKGVMTAGSYSRVTVNNKGQIIAGVVPSNDVYAPTVPYNQILNRPSTAKEFVGDTTGYIGTKVGMDNAVMTGNLTLSRAPTSSAEAATYGYLTSVAASMVIGYKVGSVVMKPSGSVGNDWLRANNGAVKKTVYPELYAVIGDTYSGFNAQDNAWKSMGMAWNNQNGFNSNDPGVLTWITGAAFVKVRVGGAAVVTKNRVYLLGGRDDSTYYDTIYTAPIDSAGIVGAWTLAGTLPTALAYAQAILTKNRVYLFGGNSLTGRIPDTYTAPINSDGMIGAWTTAQKLATPVSSGSVSVVGNRVYLFGGIPGAVQTSSGTNTIQVATIDNEGVIGAWSVYGTIPLTLYGTRTLVTSSSIYLIGGIFNLTSASSAVYRAPINSDFTLGAWTAVNSLPGPLGEENCIFATKKRVYLVGGFTGSTYSGIVYSAAINDSGYLEGWVTHTSLPTPQTAAGSFATSSRLYMVGGYNNSVYTASTSSAVFPGVTNDYLNLASSIEASYYPPLGYMGQPWRQQAVINDTDPGALTWAVDSSQLPNTTTTCRALVTKKKVYIIGGYTAGSASNAVYSARINDDGTLAAWGTETSIPTNLAAPELFITKNRAHLIGGNLTGTSGNTTNLTYSAPIDETGTIGTWVSGPVFPIKIENAAAIVTKNRAYLIGGATNGVALATVYGAAINSDGTLGTWVQETNLPVAINVSGQVFMTSSYVYILGGYTGSSYSTTIYRAPISPNGGLGTWATAGTIPAGWGSGQVVVTNKRAYMLAGRDATNAKTTVYSAPIDSQGVLGTWTSNNAVPALRDNHQAVVVKNRIYLIAGSDGNPLKTIYSAAFTGGLNDYQTLINANVINLTDEFRLPDYSAGNQGIYEYYIKALP